MSEPPQKKFRYTSFTQQINNISIDVGKTKGLTWEKIDDVDDTGQTSTPFTATLTKLALLDLTIPYQSLQRTLIPLTSSLPITLHNLEPINQIFEDFYSNLEHGHDHQSSGLGSAVELHQALYETCLGENLPHLPITVKHLLRVGALRGLDPRLVERTYSTLSLILRTIAPALLKPESETILKSTWSEVIGYFRRKENKKYVRKCVADAWAGVVRKARGEGLERLTTVMLEDDHEGLEAVWVNSMKGTPHHLHSRAVPVFVILLDRLAVRPAQLATLNLVVIAITHHCSSAAISPIVQTIVDRLDISSSIEPSPSTTLSNVSCPSPILSLLATTLFIRKGKRYPPSLLKPTMVKIGKLIPHLSQMDHVSFEDWRRSLVMCVVGILQAGQLADWLSPGVSLIESLWAHLDARESYAFSNSLVTLKWPGVEQFLLSHIARTALANLASDPFPTLILLNKLAKSGFLAGGLANVQGGRWRQSLISELVNLLAGYAELLQTSIEDRRILGQVLLLIPHLAVIDFLPLISKMVTHTVKTAGKVGNNALIDDWRETGPWNRSHLLGALLRCAQHLLALGTSDDQAILRDNIQNCIDEILQVWHWNREVLDSVAFCIDMWKSNLSLPSTTVDLIKPNLLSADSALRLSTLRIISATAQTEDDIIRDLWDICIQVESSEMTLRNVRDRTSLILKLSRTVIASQDSESLRSVVENIITYMVAQFKVNFRPLYPETVNALTTLSNQYGEPIWNTIWDQLQQINAAQVVAAVDLGVNNPGWSVTRKLPDVAERNDDEEKEFLCPNLQKGTAAVLDVWNQSVNAASLDENEVSLQISQDRLDILNYESQLLTALTAMPAIAEKRSRIFVPLVLTVARQTESGQETVPTAHLSTRQLQSRTSSYLEVMAKFVNPKAAYRTDDLYSLYLEIIAKGDSKLQGLALRCLFTYKSPKLGPYEENLTALLDESKFRDELTHFTLGVRSESIDPQHRDEVVPVAIRLLYGIITSRRGRSSLAQGTAAKKQAVLTALTSCTSGELGILVDLMLEPFGAIAKTQFRISDLPGKVPGRQQLGFLSLLYDVIRYLGPQTMDHWSKLIATTINLVHHAQQRLGPDTAEGDDIEEVDEKGAAPLRTIRSMGIKRLVQFVNSPVDFDFTEYLSAVFSSIISPRIDKLDVENTQAPSGTLELIAALACSPDRAISLILYDQRVLPKTFACMVAVKVKPSVVGRVFDIIEALLGEDATASSPKSMTSLVLLPNIQSLLDNIIGLIRQLNQAANEDLMRRLLSILSRLSAVVTDGQQAQQLASLLGPMLRQPGKQVPEKAKIDILSILRRLYAISPDFQDPSSTFFIHSYELVSNLFQALFQPSTRRALSSVLQIFAEADPTLQYSVTLVVDINAYNMRRVDEPDFDRRLSAFAKLNDADVSDLPTTLRDWLPLLRSVLFFIQEPEELSIRTNASSVLMRFVSLVGTLEEGPMVDAILQIVMPGLRRGLRSKLELVRNEVLLIISNAVKQCTGIPVLAEMKPLLADGDDEANFFVNICHIQVHRRARAIRRLRDICFENEIRETTLSTIFVPVLEHIVSGATDITDHHLVNEAILAIGALARKMRWSKYNALVIRYLKHGTPRSPAQKFFIRAVSAIIDNFHFDLVSEESIHVDDDDDEASDNGNAPIIHQGPSVERITDAILNRLLPALSKVVSQNGETDEHIRVPLALGVVKLASILPGESSFTEVTRVLTTVSQILRSKDQDTRDVARDTICKIAVYLGPQWLVQVLKELRGALQRGPQKQVLAVTTHAILVLATLDGQQEFGSLDDAVEDAAQISAEVIWGESGRDVASEGFKTKMREVRAASSRGLDTFQLISRLVSPSKIGAVLAPVREVMHVSQAVKTMQQVDETLGRIALGLNANSLLEASDLLSLCYSLVSGNSMYLKPKRKAPKQSEAADSFRVQVKRNPKVDEDLYHLNAHKFVAFGLDLFVTAFRRGKFDFGDVEILSRLGPLVSAIGNTLYSQASVVLVLGLKASAAIAKCPIPQIEEALPVVITNIFKIIKNAGGTAESEVVQTALKTLAVILRDCKGSQVTDSQLKYLLQVISPDLEDSDRQTSIFTILRAIVARRFVVPEIYDLMDRVSSIMVTSQSSHVQEICRGVLMQFLLDYPQGSGRLRAQMTFLARNLDYVFESGRISVMEVFSAIFSKFSDALLAEYADLFFVALVAVMANDEAEKCRVMAAALIQQLFGRLDNQHQRKFLDIGSTWIASRKDNLSLATASMAVYGILADDNQQVIADILPSIVTILEESAEELSQAELSDSQIHLDPRLISQTLSIATKAARLQSTPLDTLPWEAVISHLLFPHDWVRFNAARTLAASFAVRSTETMDLLGSEALLEIARKSCVLLKGHQSVDRQNIVVDAKLADQLVKLLWNISKYWATSESVSGETQVETDVDIEAEVEAEGSLGNSRPLSWLMSRMSFLARYLVINRPASHEALLSGESWAGPIMSILRFFAGIYEHLDTEQAKRFLIHVLSPIYRILDEGGDFAASESSPGLDELRLLATEVREFIQAKVGITDFSQTWESMRRKVTQKRDGRRQVRNQMAVADPQAWADRKDRRMSMKKDSKKRKIKAFANVKQRERPTKRRG